MKRTFTINLTGKVFNIDDDAFGKLQMYLDSLAAKYIPTPEGQEIIDDIESRISELCQSKISAVKQVVTIEDVDDIIGILGDPNEENKDEVKKYRTGKHIYRDIDSRLIGGVAAGLSAYYGVSVALFRIMFVLSFFLFGPLLYIALWVAIPEAKTLIQKLEMMGEPVNINNIERAVRNDLFEVQRSIAHFRTSAFFKNIEQKVSTFFRSVVTLMKPIFFIVVLALSFTFIVLTVVLIINYTNPTNFSIEYLERFFAMLSNMPFPNFSGSLIDSLHVKILLIGLFMLIFMTMLAMAYSIIRLLLRIRGRNHWFLLLVFFSVIVTGLLMVSYVAYIETQNFSTRNERIDDYIYTIDKSKILNIGLTYDIFADTKFQGNSSDNEKSYYNDPKNFGLLNREVKITSTEGLIDISVSPNIEIVASDGDSLRMSIKQISHGMDIRDAAANIMAMKYDWSIDSNSFLLAPMFSIDNTSKWRAQQMNITLEIPIGTHLNFSPEFATFFVNVKNFAFHDINDIATKNWIVTREGLKSL